MKLKEKIKVSVIDANIPLLLGLEHQTRWGMIIDLGTEEIYIRKSKDRFKKDKKTNIWTLPIQRKERPSKEIEYSADKYKKHGKTVPINNAATKEVEETRPCVRDEIKMTIWEWNENEEMIKNKKYARRKDDDPKSLERPGQENDDDKAKKN